MGIARGRKKNNTIIYVILIFWAVMMTVPFFWLISTSLKSFAESMQVPPVIIPESFHFENYVEILKDAEFFKYYTNTILMTLGRTVGTLLLSSLAAYSFAKLRFPGKNILFIIVISVLMVPPQIIMLPGFVLMSELGWLNTFAALIVPGIFSAFGVFLMRQFFMTIPNELDEAAKIDGCSYWGIYWRIYLPLSKPALVSLTIFTVLASWNDFLWPLVVTSSESMRVLSLGLASFQGQHATDYPLLMAGSFIATLPMILLFVFLQRYFIEGIAMSGIKS